MTESQKEELLIEHGNMLSAHEQQIANLYETTREIKTIAESTQTIAISVRDLTNTLTNVQCDIKGINKKFECIENEKKQKNFTIWQAVVCTAIGFIVTYVLTMVLS